VIKQTVKRKRPFERFGDNKIIVFERIPSSRSFPSWHSYNVMAQGLVFGIFFLNSLLITFFVIIIIIIVSFSRIQLGVHYPSDVIFGCIFGVIGFLLSIYLIGPLILHMLTYFELFLEFEIQYRQINSMLFNNIVYAFLTLGILLIIFFLAINKTLKERIKKKRINI
jgi:membrane-associated phospholipid phosphatase